MRGRHLVQFLGAFAKITSYEIAGIKRWYSWGRESNGDYCRSLLFNSARSFQLRWRIACADNVQIG